MIQDSSSENDVIIIGGASAGFPAAIFSARRALRTLVIAKNYGGQLTLTDSIENYPGVHRASGMELAERMAKQAETFGAVIHRDEVVSVSREGDRFVVATPTHQHRTKALILAFGKTPRDLGLAGEQALKGRGITHCAICDGPKYKGQIVAVTGGGNAAIEAALYLSRLCPQVYLIRRNSIFGGEKMLIQMLHEAQNVEFLDGEEVVEVKGFDHLEQIIVQDMKTGARKTLSVAALFVEIGFIARPELVRGLVSLNERGEIIIDRNNRTSTPFIYAAGDATDLYYKQSVISAGEGAKAALAAYDDLMRAQGKSGIKGDW